MELNQSTMEVEKSTHQCIVFKLKELKPHFNADNLSVIEIPDSSYIYVANTEQWKDKIGKKVSWIPPQNLVLFNRPEFNFLSEQPKYNKDSIKDERGEYVLIKAKKIRSLLSYGLLIEVPDSFNEGDNAASYLEVVHFDPEIEPDAVTGECAVAPSGDYPKYDVDAFMKWGNLFKEGELVTVNEKLDGENCLVVFTDKLHIRSRTKWKREFTSPPSITVESMILNGCDPIKAQEVYDLKVKNWKPSQSHFWIWQDTNPGVVKFCEENPNYSVFGECYGGKKGFNYDVKNGKRKLAVFDILKPTGEWMGTDEFYETCSKYGIVTAPVLARDWPFNSQEVKKFTEGNSTLGNHIKEGVVIKPKFERYENGLGRLSLKLLSDKYMEKS